MGGYHRWLHHVGHPLQWAGGMCLHLLGAGARGPTEMCVGEERLSVAQGHPFVVVTVVGVVRLFHYEAIDWHAQPKPLPVGARVVHL